jgi:hypothetical protein
MKDRNAIIRRWGTAEPRAADPGVPATSQEPSIPEVAAKIRCLDAEGHATIDEGIAKAEKIFVEAGRELVMLKTRMPGMSERDWWIFVREKCGIGRSWGFQLISLGTGRKRLTDLRAVNREHTRRYRERKKARTPPPVHHGDGRHRDEPGPAVPALPAPPSRDGGLRDEPKPEIEQPGAGEPEAAVLRPQPPISDEAWVAEWPNRSVATKLKLVRAHPDEILRLWQQVTKQYMKVDVTTVHTHVTKTPVAPPDDDDVDDPDKPISLN